MEGEEKEFIISHWYGNRNKDNISIHQWITDVQEAKGG
jgi:hypothetical protein